MKVKIIQSIRLENGQFLVSFKSNIGTAEGLWVGNAPTFNRIEDIEIEIEDKLKWSINVFKSSEKNPLLEKIDEKIKIVAKIESIEDNGCCILKLGDSIFMSAIEGIPYLEKGTLISLKLSTIKLFSSNL